METQKWYETTPLDRGGSPRCSVGEPAAAREKQDPR